MSAPLLPSCPLAWHLGEGDAADVCGGEPRLCQRLLHELHRPLLVVQRSLAGQEALSWRRDEAAGWQEQGRRCA